MKRVNIKAILSDPKERRKMMAGAIRFIQAVEGRDLMEQESLDVYDLVSHGEELSSPALQLMRKS